MTADDEFRKVAEDLRGLARALRSEFRAAKWEAREAAREARRGWRWDGWSPWCGPGGPPPRWWEHPRWQGPPPPSATVAPGTGSTSASAAPPGGAGDGAQPGATGAAQAGSATTTTSRGAGPPGSPPWGPPWGGRPWPWGPYQPPPRAPVVTAPPKPAPPAPPPVRHRRDGSTLISLLLVLVGLAWLGSASGVVNLSLETVLAAVLVVLGAAMVVTARTDWNLSHRHWPVWLGLAVLVLVMATAGSAGGLSRLHFGPTTVSPQAADLGTPITNFAGPITVTLPSKGPARSTTLKVHDVFGPISVVIPSKVPYAVAVDARSHFGPVSVPGGTNRRGMFPHKTATIGSGKMTLRLVVDDVFGPVTVTQGT